MKWLKNANNFGCPYNTWSEWNMCPEASYAAQFNIRYEEEVWPDTTALNSIKIKCFDDDGNYAG